MLGALDQRDLANDGAMRPGIADPLEFLEFGGLEQVVVLDPGQGFPLNDGAGVDEDPATDLGGLVSVLHRLQGQLRAATPGMHQAPGPGHPHTQGLCWRCEFIHGSSVRCQFVTNLLNCASCGPGSVTLPSSGSV